MGLQDTYFDDVEGTHDVSRRIQQLSRDLEGNLGSWEKELKMLNRLDNVLVNQLNDLYEKYEDVPQITSRLLKLANQLDRILTEIKESSNLYVGKKEEIDRISQQVDSLYRKEVGCETGFTSKVETYIVENSSDFDFRVHGTPEIQEAATVIEEGLELGEGSVSGISIGLEVKDLKQVMEFLLAYPAKSSRKDYKALVIIGLNRDAVKNWKKDYEDLSLEREYLTTEEGPRRIEWPDGVIHPSLILGYIDLVSKEFHLNSDFESDQTQIKHYPELP